MFSGSAAEIIHAESRSECLTGITGTVMKRRRGGGVQFSQLFCRQTSQYLKESESIFKRETDSSFLLEKKTIRMLTSSHRNWFQPECIIKSETSCIMPERNWTRSKFMNHKEVQKHRLHFLPGRQDECITIYYNFPFILISYNSIRAVKHAPGRTSGIKKTTPNQ